MSVMKLMGKACLTVFFLLLGLKINYGIAAVDRYPPSQLNCEIDKSVSTEQRTLGAKLCSAEQSRDMPLIAVPYSPNEAVDIFGVGDVWVKTYKHDRLIGNYPVRYRFSVLDFANKEEWFIALASYQGLNQDSSAPRIFHLTAYSADSIQTFRFFTSEPSYDDLRSIISQIITRKVTPIVTLTPLSHEKALSLEEKEKRYYEQEKFHDETMPLLLQGKLDEVYVKQTARLAVIKETQGPYSRYFKSVQGLLLQAYYDKGEWDKLEAIYLTSVQAAELKHGKDSHEVREALFELADVYQQDGRLKEAETMFLFVMESALRDKRTANIVRKSALKKYIELLSKLNRSDEASEITARFDPPKENKWEKIDSAGALVHKDSGFSFPQKVGAFKKDEVIKIDNKGPGDKIEYSYKPEGGGRLDTFWVTISILADKPDTGFNYPKGLKYPEKHFKLFQRRMAAQMHVKTLQAPENIGSSEIALPDGRSIKGYDAIFYQPPSKGSGGKGVLDKLHVFKIDNFHVEILINDPFHAVRGEIVFKDLISQIQW